MGYRKLISTIGAVSLAVISLFVPKGSLILASLSSAVLFYSFGMSRFIVGLFLLLLVLTPSKMSFEMYHGPGYFNDRDFEILEGSRSFENVENLEVYGKGVRIVGDPSSVGVSVSGGMRFKFADGDLEVISNHGGEIVLGKCESISIYGMDISISRDFEIESLEIYGMSNDIRGSFEGLRNVEIDGLTNDVDVVLNSVNVILQINGTSNDVRLDLTRVKDGSLKIEVNGTSNDVIVTLSRDSKVQVYFEGNPRFLNDFKIRRK